MSKEYENLTERLDYLSSKLEELKYDLESSENLLKKINEEEISVRKNKEYVRLVELEIDYYEHYVNKLKLKMKSEIYSDAIYSLKNYKDNKKQFKKDKGDRGLIEINLMRANSALRTMDMVLHADRFEALNRFDILSNDRVPIIDRSIDISEVIAKINELEGIIKESYVNAKKAKGSDKNSVDSYIKYIETTAELTDLMYYSMSMTSRGFNELSKKVIDKRIKLRNFPH